MLELTQGRRICVRLIVRCSRHKIYNRICRKRNSFTVRGKPRQQAVRTWFITNETIIQHERRMRERVLCNPIGSA
jgi:hypothetical protein